MQVKELEQAPQSRQVAFIRLKGEPYQRCIEGVHGQENVDCSLTLENLASDSNYNDRLKQDVKTVEGCLGELFEGQGYYGIDRKLKQGEDLTFNEAFSLITFVCASLNQPLNSLIASRIKNIPPRETHLLQATALLATMSGKESYRGLTSDEIAGMVAATITLDTIARIKSNEPIFGFGGMGGDKGYPLNGDRSKLFSLSTLSSIALAVETPVHKHHSYPNTSKVAGQSAIEACGARSDFHSISAFEKVLKETGLIMTSCHDTRTLHTLSHLLRGETVNHVIGPLAFTIDKETPIHAFVGVNEKIPPETIIDTLRILHKKGFQKYTNSVVFCGTDLKEADAFPCDAKTHILIDEIAPPPYTTLAAFLVNGVNMGTFQIKPEDFYPEEILSQFSLDNLLVPNTTESIHCSNIEALTMRDPAKSYYLAMTVGLALFVRHVLVLPDALDLQTRRVNKSYLRECTNRALEIIRQGKAARKLADYVESTKRFAGRGLNG
ncbi:MAG TPA: hypothetical protein DDZ05_02080 [Candidatus Blackburnbacteria bacterium]|uniref:Glycosyl transferase family 3 domain-containing protein n=1 Tax=Candidatus Blackburnbacteria bacterium RIFCSPLOWO2_01_FULL_40_20 TaxID=1797519 RepID=A0A1G1VB90_9BACT|nr:MAG: hypothetical protein A3A77_00830 [Candidatus Blackburnbacteria bacterium RIFCSPLOWO2_01_FULL_40_20]HBL51988.1 hypothetical protein [Candidatus Blackburnbacteria bacterium]